MLFSQSLLLFGIDLLAKIDSVAVFKLARTIHGRKLRVLIFRGIDHAFTEFGVLPLNRLHCAVDRLIRGVCKRDRTKGEQARNQEKVLHAQTVKARL